MFGLRSTVLQHPVLTRETFLLFLFLNTSEGYMEKHGLSLEQKVVNIA